MDYTTKGEFVPFTPNVKLMSLSETMAQKEKVKPPSG